MMISMILWITIAFSTFYYFCVRPLQYWKNLGVHQGRPLWLFGDNIWSVLGLECFMTTIDKGYKNAVGKRYFGFYTFLKPILVVKDPDLIKEITIKAFDNFADHRVIMPVEADPLWGKNVVELKGEEWRAMRPHMSPAFTSGKIKSMHGLMSNCADNLVNYFLKKNEKSFELDVKDAMTRYTNDVIAIVAFGVSVDSMNNPDNEFLRMALKATDITRFWPTLSAMAAFVLPPSLMKIFGMKVFDDDVHSYFLNVLEDSLQMRRKSGIQRSDLIDSLLEAQSEAKKADTKRQLADDDILSQAMIFFIGGFDTVSKLMLFMCYELAINKEVQDRLRKEIVEKSRGNNGKITYDDLMKMEYMDMVISETLRKWPVMSGIDRTCTKTYKIEPVSPGEQPLVVPKGLEIWLPVWSIHRDENYFPDPEKFDPERFNEKNKAQIHPYAYNAFGFGPRSCIGNRFTLLKCKILFSHLLSNFELEPCKKTKIPMGILQKGLFISPEVDVFVNVKRIAN